MEEYDIEPWDSTSTMRYPTFEPMPSEEEGFQIANKQVAQMFNPIETAKGLAAMGEGIYNDTSSMLGAQRSPEDPSFARSLKDLGSRFSEDPYMTAADIVMAPGSVPGLFTGRLPFALKRAPLNSRVLDQATKQAKRHGGYVDEASINANFRNSQELWKSGLKVDKDNNIVLQRWADNEPHMTKDWQPENQAGLKETSRVTGGGGGLPTSVADAGFGTGHRKMLGEFKIPAKKFPKAFKDRNAIFGNVGEGEIVLNPAWAKQYYSPVKSNWSPPPKSLTQKPPSEIFLDL